jgi:hypothetical protein
MLPPQLLAVLLSADPKPNFHRNNDRKERGGMQGLGGCGLFQILCIEGAIFSATVTAEGFVSGARLKAPSVSNLLI